MQSRGPPTGEPFFDPEKKNFSRGWRSEADERFMIGSAQQKRGLFFGTALEL